MPYWIWIIIAVVVLALIGLGVGLALGRRRRVSLTPPAAEPAADTKPPVRGGGYKAGGSISFSAGSDTAAGGGAGAATLDRAPETSQQRAPHGQPVPESTTPERPEPATSPDAEPATTPDGGLRLDGEPPAPTDVHPASAAPASAAPAAGEATPLEEPGPVEQRVAVEEPADGVTVAPAPAAVEPAGPASEGEPAAVAPAPPTEAPVTDTSADISVEAPAAGAAPGAGVTQDIAPTAGRLVRLRGRLARSQTVFGRSLLGLLGAGDLDEDSWQDVEDTLLTADLGAAAALEITQNLRDRVAAGGVADAAAARALLRAVLIDAVGTQADRSVRALPHDGRPAVALVVGVNGTGKTTTTGKLARVLVADGRSVVLGAADTFRAAAADQLATWGERVGATVVRGAERADPAAVAFDAVKKGIDAGVDAVLIDTAGRLHTKTGLMDELGKVKRVVEKQAAVDEVLLVLDATTGQNGLVQAKVFADVVDVTGIVLTKLDGTAKGGIVIAVQRALGVPVKLVGLGEGPDDLAPFEPAAFVDALLGD